MGDPGLATTQLLIRSPRRRGLRQILADLRQELSRANGLGNVAIATRSTSLLLSSTQRVSGDCDNRNIPQHSVCLKPTCRLIPVDTGKLDIHQDEVRLLRCCRGKTRLAVLGFNHLKVGAGQQIPQDPPIIWLILDDQDALAHPCTAYASTRTGTVK